MSKDKSQEILLNKSTEAAMSSGFPSEFDPSIPGAREAHDGAEARYWKSQLKPIGAEQILDKKDLTKP